VVRPLFLLPSPLKVETVNQGRKEKPARETVIAKTQKPLRRIAGTASATWCCSLGEKDGTPIGAAENSMITLEISGMVDRSVAVRVSNMIVPVLVLMTATVLRADDVVRHWNKVMLAAVERDQVT
jgi:hypothetical protein